MSVVLIVMLIITYFLTQYFLINSDVKLEQRETQSGIGRVLSVLNNQIAFLEDTTSDWAFWDDTYNFADNLNLQYVDENITPSTFISLQVDAMVLTDTQGEFLYGKAYDKNKQELIEVPQSLTTYLATSNPLNSSLNSENAIGGIILLPEGPMLIASCPVLTSAKTGPPHGILTMARYLDNKEIKYLADMTLSPISIYPINSPQLPADFSKAYQQMTPAKSVIVMPQNNNTVSGYALINDIDGKPALIIKADFTRDLYNKGHESARFIMLILIICAICAGIIAILTQNRITIYRIKKLNKDIQQINTSGDMSSRIKKIDGKDEFSDFADNINKMLATIEEQKTKEVILRKSLEAEMNKRADYTRELAHELKTPITPILSSSELLTEGIKEEPWLSLAKNIYRGATDMNDRLDDLLDMAKGEVGILRLNMEEIDPISLIQHISEEMAPLIHHRQQTLALDLPPALPHIMGDEVRLRQVLRNLLNNATKFTPEKGKITIRAKRNDNNLVVEVEDTGSGIDADKMSKVFLPYVRLGEATEHQKGLGLGLKLSKTLVELHGGMIWVSSQKGVGSKFSFSVPVISNQGKDIVKKRENQ
jgi:signal transduction histidine kinase